MERIRARAADTAAALRLKKLRRDANRLLNGRRDSASTTTIGQRINDSSDREPAAQHTRLHRSAERRQCSSPAANAVPKVRITMSRDPAIRANLVQKPRRSRNPGIASAHGSTSPNPCTLQAGSGVFRNMGTSELAKVDGPAAIRDTPCMQMLSPSVSLSSRKASAAPRQWDRAVDLTFSSTR